MKLTKEEIEMLRDARAALLIAMKTDSPAMFRGQILAATEKITRAALWRLPER
jgi:hypothetical protein